MTEEPKHKFQGQAPVTYEQFFIRRYSGLIDFYKELEKTVSKEHLRDVLRNWSERSSVDSVGDLRVENFEEFKEYWKTVSYGDYFSQVVTVEFPHETDKELRCKYTECLFAKTFRDLGAEELGKIIGCDADHIFVETMNPKLKLKRTKTLMEGHGECNHTFIWDE
ncbi:MAG: L-2-amino-thiazoline-4-carboxylic acid hydrolase [Candidatus Thorarchaeota archaeon]|jgi:hypothetical protein